MASGAHGVDTANAVRQVNDTLQGPVLDILAKLVPELKSVPRATAYERTLDDIDLLERCFKAFRRERARFRALLVDENRQPVAADDVRLSCGRTLDEVVAMVVRTAAKRYFRRRHDPGNADKPVAARLRQEIQGKGLVHRVGGLVKGDDGGKAVHAKSARSRADELYDAIKAHLLHEWQVPMVPTYAEMPPTLVRSLGAKLLEVRELDHLRRILDDPAEAAKLFDLPEEEGTAAVAEPPRRDERARLSDILAGDSKYLRVEAFASALSQARVKALVKTADQPQRTAEILRSVGAIPTKLLVAELGLRLDQLAVVLLVAHDVVGMDVFRRIFGQPGNPEMVMRVTQRARAAGIGQHSPLDQCAAFVRELFARFAA
mgnify:CR=1 FL=1